MAGTAAKRFYDAVSVVEETDGFAVALDDRIAKTPSGRRLAFADRNIADAVAAEWQAQETDVRPHEMPLTRLAGEALDRVVADRARVIDQIVAYASADLLSYRAESPVELRLRQDAAWQPLLDWAATTLAAPLAVTAGIVAVIQEPTAIEAVHRAVDDFDDLSLAALSSATAACGSVILSLALAAGEIDADAAFDLSQLDETFQIERWGEDAEATERRRLVRADIKAAATILFWATGKPG
jgi:chaperone required for assembly of F1-ATPase